MAPKLTVASLRGMPRARSRNAGIHTASPPTANVYAAYPRTVRTYGLFCASREQGEIASRKPRESGGEAPAGYAESDQSRPRTPIAQGAEYRRRQRVHHQEAGHERSQVRIRETQIRMLQAFDQGGNDVAIQIAEQVDEREYRETETRRAHPGL